MIALRDETLVRLAGVIASIGTKDFAASLLDLCEGAARSDASAILVYHRDRAPEVASDRLIPEERPYLYGDYLAGVYRLSPFFRAALNLKRSSLLRLKDIMPEGFRQSEYYRKYYVPIGAPDLLGALVPLTGGTVIHISLSRSADHSGFAQSDIKSLSALLPILAAAVERHWPGRQARGKRAPPEPKAIFSREYGLTSREAQIADAVLAGHSLKSTARLLAISTETVKVHRKHLYAKLGISSQGELFQRFLARLPR